MACNDGRRELLELVCDVAKDRCDALLSGWRDCDHRENSQFMARGYKCRSCRAKDALELARIAALPGELK